MDYTEGFDWWYRNGGDVYMWSCSTDWVLLQYSTEVPHDTLSSIWDWSWCWDCSPAPAVWGKPFSLTVTETVFYLLVIWTLLMLLPVSMAWFFISSTLGSSTPSWGTSPSFSTSSDLSVNPDISNSLRRNWIWIYPTHTNLKGKQTWICLNQLTYPKQILIAQVMSRPKHYRSGNG